MKLSYAVAVLAWYPAASAAAAGQDPPPKPLEFYGYTIDTRGTPLQAFFREAEKIYIAAAGDLVKERYRVVRINVDSAVLEDTFGALQTLPLASRNPNNNNSAVPERIPAVAPPAIPVPVSAPLAVPASEPSTSNVLPGAADQPKIRPSPIRRRHRR